MANWNNDDFANRIALSGFNLSVSGINLGFTGEVDELDHAGVSGELNSAWWTWTAPVSGEVVWDTFGSDFDTTLAVYTGSTLSSLTEVASNDDFGALQSAVRFNVVAGTTYQIAVDGFDVQTGNIMLNLNLLPNNDNFANRIALNGFNVSTTGNNVGFTREFGELNHAGVSGELNSAWWSWTAPASGEVVLDTFGSDFDTSLAVYTGDSLGQLSSVAGNDDANGSLQSEVVFDVIAGTTYQIAVDGYAIATGDIALNLNLVPNNDDFAHRTALNGVEIETKGTNIGFTGEFQEPDHAGLSDTTNSAWWTWIAPDSGEVTLTTLGSDFDTSLAVYTGSTLNTLTEVTSNDNAGIVLHSTVTFDAVAGTTYQIAVDGVNDEMGNISLALELEPDQPPSMPTVDLILDFDGGVVTTGQGYDIPTPAFDGFNFSGFTALDRGDGTAGNLDEQIFQIVAGVREDFADFNVRVIWDDQGVDSPFFDNQDTVIMVVGDSATVIGLRDIFGIAANVDVPEFTGAPLQSQRDTGFTFLPPHVGIGPNTYNEIRELIDTISHEAGHTFGLSHADEQDSEGRQLVTTAGQNRNLDSRFSPEVLSHGAPESGINYAETDRLNQAVGAAAVLPGDTQSGQTLPLDPTTPFVGLIDPSDPITAGGTIDFLGDRDAFRFETDRAGQFTIEQIATGALTPVLTLWDAAGDFLAVGSGANSTITFSANANETFYAVAGSDVDRLISGVEPVGEIGGYTLTFG
ncbi:peptidase s8 and s53 subtilisin kexin sedolisin [Leptolyngbya sp. Heron Island J]|uniref:peptidase S8 n=1 Tax=Leptolyngbya sp. Heron Island J TaxID=1385935 RepID=UPI0003B9ACC2|nr:peptidase S8 [Leptolyngbya sp. Heron Island J]ESA35241.1 peptidase s8 and s53 subtilisin kexin sedolisin [Leptolyngbya sp. Heron Island J]